MATSVDKYYATEGEKSSLTENEEQPFSRHYERISNTKPSISEDQPFTESQMLRDPKTKYTILFFVFIVAVVVLITCILSIIQGIKIGPIYILLGVSILCIAFVELLLIYLVKKDDLPREKLWFVFFVGFVIFMESILTNILLYY